MSSPVVMEEDKFNRITVPIFSTKWAIVLCICNFLVPGLGTCLAGLSLCCPCSDNPSFSCADYCCSAWLQFGIGALQLLLTPLCLLGWVWSCVWGCAFIGRSNPEWRARSQQRHQEAMMSLVTEQPTTASSQSHGIRGLLGLGDFRSSRRWPRSYQRGFRGPLDYGLLPPPDYQMEQEPPPPPYEETVQAGDEAREQRWQQQQQLHFEALQLRS